MGAMPRAAAQESEARLRNVLPQSIDVGAGEPRSAITDSGGDRCGTNRTTERAKPIARPPSVHRPDVAPAVR